MFMSKRARATLATNVKRLREFHSWSQAELARRAGLGQTTISAVENPEGKSSGVDNIEALANAFSVEPWLLLVPGLPDDALKNHSFSKIVRSYAESSAEGRSNIARVAESEARYTIISKTVNS